MAEAELLTTKEVAALLRVKERKIYDLAAAGEIPHRRLVGKLLFPRDEILSWIGGAEEASRPATLRPDILVGSHDPLLDWALRECGSGLASFLDGSRDGLSRFQSGEAALCGLHIPEGAGRWNETTLAAAERLDSAVLIAWARRRQGLILAPALVEKVTSLKDLTGLRLALRQVGAGTRELFDLLSTEAGLQPERLAEACVVARTESEAAEAVASGQAVAALGLLAAARSYGLGFLDLVEERFDLLIDRRAYFTPPVQTLLAFARTPEFAAKAEALGGYDITDLGQVRWLP